MPCELSYYWNSCFEWLIGGRWRMAASLSSSGDCAAGNTPLLADVANSKWNVGITKVNLCIRVYKEMRRETDVASRSCPSHRCPRSRRESRPPCWVWPRYGPGAFVPLHSDALITAGAALSLAKSNVKIITHIKESTNQDTTGKPSGMQCSCLSPFRHL